MSSPAALPEQLAPPSAVVADDEARSRSRASALSRSTTTPAGVGGARPAESGRSSKSTAFSLVMRCNLLKSSFSGIPTGVLRFGTGSEALVAQTFGSARELSAIDAVLLVAGVASAPASSACCGPACSGAAVSERALPLGALVLCSAPRSRSVAVLREEPATSFEAPRAGEGGRLGLPVLDIFSVHGLLTRRAVAVLTAGMLRSSVCARRAAAMWRARSDGWPERFAEPTSS
mmetsp:Transcript_53154/g.122111  ORF Transcript_53154/g.122111 Transcript_53154/m.122111 type:complete len:232 (+) Transcript_53154:880-1575(+)